MLNRGPLKYDDEAGGRERQEDSHFLHERYVRLGNIGIVDRGRASKKRIQSSSRGKTRSEAETGAAIR